MGASRLKQQIRCHVETPAGEIDEYSEDLLPGTKLLGGQYTITNFLNSGGFGITYLAKDIAGQNVVIKECFPDSMCKRSGLLVRPTSRSHEAAFASVVKLFVREARNQAKLSHPNIARLQEVFSENNTAYMAIEYVNGADLMDVIEIDSGITPECVEHWLRQSLKSLGFVHDAGVLHRDISPDNILINHENEPILIDFGAAREQASHQDRVLSTLQLVKDGYSPYEFYVKGSPQSPSSDLYGLAATFYHVLTGKAPTDSQSRLAAVAQDLDDLYTPLAGRFPDYPDSMLRSIDMALKVLPRERLQSAQQWLDMLDEEAPISVPSSEGQVRPMIASSQSKLNTAITAFPTSQLVAAVVIGCVMIFGWGHDVASLGSLPTAVTATSVAN